MGLHAFYGQPACELTDGQVGAWLLLRNLYDRRTKKDAQPEEANPEAPRQENRIETPDG